MVTKTLSDDRSEFVKYLRSLEYAQGLYFSKKECRCNVDRRVGLVGWTSGRCESVRLVVSLCGARIKFALVVECSYSKCSTCFALALNENTEIWVIFEDIEKVMQQVYLESGSLLG